MCEFEVCLGSTAPAPNSLAGRTKNGWDSTHIWSRCHFKPKPGYMNSLKLALLPPSAFRQWWESYNHTSNEELNKTGCAAVTELALSKTANTMRQGEWDSLYGLSLFCPSFSSPRLSTHTYALMWGERWPNSHCELGEPSQLSQLTKTNSADMLNCFTVKPAADYVSTVFSHISKEQCKKWQVSSFWTLTWCSHPKLHQYIPGVCYIMMHLVFSERLWSNY